MYSTYLEILATIFGLIQGVLILQNKRSNWVFYILNICAMLMFSAVNHLYGDVLNNIIYMAMGIFGAILWSNKTTDLKITKCPTSERISYTLTIIFTTIVFGLILSKTSDPLPFKDAFSTITSFIATWYMVKRKTDAWILWTINDISYVIEYYMLPNPAYWLVGLNMIWTFMAILSYINWNKIMESYKKQVLLHKK